MYVKRDVPISTDCNMWVGFEARGIYIGELLFHLSSPWRKYRESLSNFMRWHFDGPIRSHHSNSIHDLLFASTHGCTLQCAVVFTMRFHVGVQTYRLDFSEIQSSV